MTTTTVKETRKLSGPNLASLIPWEHVSEPGAYVCNWNGYLLRIPEGGISSDGCPYVYMIGPEPLFVTKISDDPHVTISKARMLACNFDITVNF